MISHFIETSAASSQIVAAVNTVAGLNAWWCPDVVAGDDEFTLTFVKGEMTVVMVFDVVEAGDEGVVWTCRENGNPAWVGSTLAWRIRDGGVALEHDNFAFTEGPPYEMTVQGWPPFVDALSAHLGA